jgi:hypothetical protein
VLNRALRAEPREIVGPAETARESFAAGGEAVRVVAAAFAEEGEMRHSVAAIADDVDYARHGIGTVKRAFGSAYDFYGTGSGARSNAPPKSFMGIPSTITRL